MTNNDTTTISRSKTNRNELPLPTAHFVVVDDWVKKLGEKTFFVWWKLYARVDRTQDQKDVVRYSQAKLAKALDMTKPTLLTHTKKLYEYGLVDYQQYQVDATHTAENIIVHKYPQNNYALAVQPLEKCRNWDDRVNENYAFTKRGGAPRKPVIDVPVEEIEENLPEELQQPAEQQESQDDITNLPSEVAYEFTERITELVENKVDIKVLKHWLYTYDGAPIDSCFVIKQLATYAEPIENTAGFITATLEKERPFNFMPLEYIEEQRIAIKNELDENIVSTTKQPIPFYNWLDKK